MKSALANKNMKFAAVTAIFSLLFPAFLPTVASAQTALEEIRQTGILKVGIRKDAPPFGYLEGEKWQGVCIEGLELFRADLEKKIQSLRQLRKTRNRPKRIIGKRALPQRYQQARSPRMRAKYNPQKSPQRDCIFPAFFIQWHLSVSKARKQTESQSFGIPARRDHWRAERFCYRTIYCRSISTSQPANL